MKKNILKTLLEDYARVNQEIIFAYCEQKSNLSKKSLINSSNALKNAIDDIVDNLKEVEELKPSKQKEFLESPKFLLIKDKKGFYSKYEKLFYYTNHILYGNCENGILIKHFGFKELKELLENKEVYVQ